MSDAAKIVIRWFGRGAGVLALALCAAVPARAQRTPEAPPAHAEFLPHYTFNLAGAAIGSSDQAFSWDTHFGGEVEIIDYVLGRAAFLADYQAILGSEFRPFDPNQGNYLLDLSGSLRAPAGVEFVGVFHHISRHLSDRYKRFPIAWNMLQARALRRFAAGSGTTVDVRADIGKVVAQTYVDYSWEGDLEFVVRHAVTPHVGLYAKALGQTMGVDESLKRTRQDGGRVEGGVRLTGGQQGSVELYVGYEKMIDASLIDFQPRQWAFAGFRIVGN